MNGPVGAVTLRGLLLLGFILVVLAGNTACRKETRVAAGHKGPSFIELPAGRMPLFRDTFSAEPMLEAIDRQLTYWDRLTELKPLILGDREIAGSQMRATLLRFREIWSLFHHRPKLLNAKIRREFRVFQFRWDDSPHILITGYYSPVFEGSTTPSARYRYPLYALPEDLLQIRTSRFDPSMLRKGEAPRGERIAARLDPAKNDILPYHTRIQIDEENALAGRGLELVYLKTYFETFLFQVQGGGFVKLADGSMIKLDFAGKNGWPYTSIGKVLVREGKIPREEISIQAIQDYFRRFPDEVKRVCYQNLSYVFYEAGKDSRQNPEAVIYPNGVLGFPVTPHRSIATDKAFFPGGSLCFLQGEQRRLKGRPEPFSAFVIDQDTGGAIKQAHVDFYLGAGKSAGHSAGLLKDEHGELFFLVLK